MKILLLSSLLMLVSAVSYAKASKPTHASLTSLMQEVRDPYFESTKRKQYLEFTLTNMKSLLAKELGVTPENLTKAFLENQSHMKRLWESPWLELQTEFYTTLHQEMLYQRWLQRTKKKKISEYGNYISQAMIMHLGKYSGVKEGRLYNRWNDHTEIKNGKKIIYRIPSFVFAPDTKSLLETETHTSYQEILPEEKDESPSNPSRLTLIKNSGKKSADDLQELAEVIQLNHRIYLRAVANASKTVASVHYLTGEYTLTQTKVKVESFIDEFCDGCSSLEKEDFKTAAMVYIKKVKTEFAQSYTAKSIVSTFCADLKDNGYSFPEKPDLTKRPIDIYERPSVAIDNTRVNLGNKQGQIALLRLSALRKTVAEHDLGVLFLTKALSNISIKQDVAGTWLGCKPETEADDINRVKTAVGEAKGKVEEYLTLIDTKIKASVSSVDTATKTLEYFTQTNISATSEAVMTFPQGARLVIDSVVNLDNDVKRRKRQDQVVAWGGTIVGIGLTISGVGAPEGTAVLLVVASMMKGAMLGTYFMYRSQQEKLFLRELIKARSGLGNNFYLDENLSQHFDEYQTLRMTYMTEFACASVQFVKIHQLALVQSQGDVVKAHGLLLRTFQKARAISKSAGQTEVTSLLVKAAL